MGSGHSVTLKPPTKSLLIECDAKSYYNRVLFRF